MMLNLYYTESLQKRSRASTAQICGTLRMPVPARNPANPRQAATDRAVRQLLASSPSFNALPAGHQRALASDMVKVARFIVAGAHGDTIPTRATLSTEFSSEVDFPAFVSALIHGVFQAVVAGSIQQMEAYSDLLKDAIRTIDQFAADGDTDDHRSATGAARRLRLNRQQLLATMVLMGINRIAAHTASGPRPAVSDSPASGITRT
jgi:hypothetical protein